MATLDAGAEATVIQDGEMQLINLEWSVFMGRSGCVRSRQALSALQLMSQVSESKRRCSWDMSPMMILSSSSSFSLRHAKIAVRGMIPRQDLTQPSTESRPLS